MGVKNLWTLIRALFPDSLSDCASSSQALRACASLSSSSQTNPASSGVQKLSTNINILVDLNGFLHRASFSTATVTGNRFSSDDECPVRTNTTPNSSENQIVSQVLGRLDRIIFAKTTKPAYGNTQQQQHKSNGIIKIKSVYIALDGPPPLAKLILQRSRRLTVSKKRRTTTEALRFNSLNFTPGSLFMTRLDATLSHYAASVISRNPWIQECIISGSCVPGEGEVKIVERLSEQSSELNRLSTTSTISKGVRDVNMLVTGDSDGIVQGRSLFSYSIELTACAVVLFASSTTPTTLYNPDQRLFFSLPPIQKALHSLFQMIPESSQAFTRIQHDLALLFVLASGNDTCPGMPRVYFEYLWASYVDLIREQAKLCCHSRASVKNKQPQQQNMKEIDFLINVESGSLDLKVLELLLVKTLDMIKVGEVTTVGVFDNTKVAEASMMANEEIVVSEDGDDEVVVPAASSKSTTSQQDLFAEPAGQYIDMILWTLNTNTTGKTRDYHLLYQFSKGPTSKAMLDWLSRMNSTKTRHLFWKGDESRIRERKPLVPGLCAVAVESAIPPEDRNLIHPSFHPLTLQYASGIETTTALLESEALQTTPITKRINKKPMLLESFTTLQQDYEKARIQQKTRFDESIHSFMPPVRVRHVASVDVVGTRRDLDGSVGGGVESVKPVVPVGGSGMRFLTWEEKGKEQKSNMFNAGQGGMVFEVWVGGEWVWLKDVDCFHKARSSSGGGWGKGKKVIGLPSGFVAFNGSTF
ncbi:UNVERIFIED_CONTAM: hypothetical protein HDU68_011147 [Siphonaria sp. JEL0065]|nr:hypothetical protein HDU68_011147 [Siphonaria sp. JEL0065]